MSEDDLHSRSRNCAFLGREVQGRCLLTLAGGRTAHRGDGRGGGMSDVGLYLADGTSWPGVSVGAPGAAVGEAVFTTAMTGYQEALTDPSFARQILAFTAPMIGNYGVEDDVSESRRVQPTALICHEARNYAPNGRQGLLDWLRAGGIVALSGLDTRALVRHLRDRGAMLGVACGEGVSRAQALELLAAEPPMAGRLLAGEVSGELAGLPQAVARCHVVVLDYGAKASIVRLLEQAGATVTVLPHDATAAQVDALAPDGVLLANGPGDPGSMDAHVAEVRAMVDQGGRSTASASAISCSGARSGSRRSSCRSGTAAPTTRSTRRPPAACS